MDGVLVPFPGCPRGYRERALAPGGPPVPVAPAHRLWLHELARVFQLAWATGWGPNANRLLSPFLGLPPLPGVELPPGPYRPQLKVPGVDALCRDRPAAWVDDIVTDEAREWAAARGAPTLLLETDPARGLTRSLVDRLLAWGKRLV